MNLMEKIAQYYTPKQFYITGMTIFLIVMICNIISLNYYWAVKILSDKVSSIAMIVFEGGLFLFFYNMYVTFKTANKLVEPTSEEELDKLIEEEQ